MIRASLRKDSAARQADYDEAVKLTPKDPIVLRFRGMHYLTQNNIELAVADFNAAIALDPEYSRAYGVLAWTHLVEAWHAWSDDPAQSIDRYCVSQSRAQKRPQCETRAQSQSENEIRRPVEDVTEGRERGDGQLDGLAHTNDGQHGKIQPEQQRYDDQWTARSRHRGAKTRHGSD